MAHYPELAALRKGILGAYGAEQWIAMSGSLDACQRAFDTMDVARGAVTKECEVLRRRAMNAERIIGEVVAERDSALDQLTKAQTELRNKAAMLRVARQCVSEDMATLRTIHAAMLRPGMYAGEQGDRSLERWQLDAIEAVYSYDGPVVHMP